MTPPSPSAGDMWRWHTNGICWTVILIDQSRNNIWNCLCLDDGAIEPWHFTDIEMPYWEFVA